MTNRPSTEYGFLSKEGFEQAVREVVGPMLGMLVADYPAFASLVEGVIERVQRENNRRAFDRAFGYPQILEYSPPTIERLPEPPYEADPIKVGPFTYVDRNDITGVVWAHLHPIILTASGHEVKAERWSVDVWSPEAQESAMDDCLIELGWKK